MMAPFVSVITPFSRGIEELETLVRDFRNQTFKDFEHLIIHDGSPVRPEILEFFVKNKGYYHPSTAVVPIEKDTGNMSIAPGTKPRNHGISLAKGKYVVFCDDDDRYKDTFLENITKGLDGKSNMMNVVQMTCAESRMARNGDPTRIRLVPELGLPTFPIICHVGTPCFIVKRGWAKKEPWRDEPEHDYRFIKRICERFKPQIRLIPGMFVDVDGLVTRGMKDWVSIPPFWRGE